MMTLISPLFAALNEWMFTAPTARVAANVSTVFLEGSVTPPHDIETSAAAPRTAASRKRMLSFRKGWLVHSRTDARRKPRATSGGPSDSLRSWSDRRAARGGRIEKPQAGEHQPVGLRG